MAGIEDYVYGMKINGVPNPYDEPFYNPDQFATPQGGQLTTRPNIVNTPNSSTGAPFRQYPGVPQATPTQQGSPLTLTPNSRTGAPAPGVPTFEAGSPMPGFGGRTGAGIGGGVGALQAFPTPTPDQMTEKLNNPPLADDPWLFKTLGGLFGGGPQAAAAPFTGNTSNEVLRSRAYGGDPAGNPVPYTGSGPGRSPSGPLPPGPPGGDALPPFNRGPIPYDLSGNNVPYPPPRPKDATAPYPPRRPKDGGGGGGGGRGASPGPAPPMQNLQPQPGWTTIDRPNADVAGGRSVAGQLAPQYFNRAREPGGPAQMGAFDFSTLFNHPQVAAAAAAQPMVQAHVAARAQPRAPVRGPLGHGALGYPVTGSGSPTPMDIQDRTRGVDPGTGSPTPMDIQDRTRGRGRLPYTPEDMAYQ